MRKIYKLFACLLMVTTSIQAATTSTTAAQPYRVKALVIDSSTGEPLPYVTCSVISDEIPQQVIVRFAGDAEGKIDGGLRSPGNYTLIISFVGKQTSQHRFTVDTQHTHADLGTIRMHIGEETLADLDVVANRPLIKADADKIIYDTAQDPEAKSSSILDILRKVPMVTVDGQDNIQLKGSSNFRFHLNGKPTNMFNVNPGMILKSIPASMIQRIEVITQPGAKYDAEGVGGIINIVFLERASAQGYSATINAQASSRGSLGGGLNLMVQQGKFSFSGNYNYNHNIQFPITITSSQNTYVEGTPYPAFNQKLTSNNTVPMQMGSGELSYEPDSLNLITLSFNRNFLQPGGIAEGFANNFDGNQNLLFSYDIYSNQRQTWGNTDLGVDYQRSFRKEAELLTLSYRLSNTPRSSGFETTNTLRSDYHSSPVVPLLHKSNSENIANTNEHTLQIDYTNPLAKDHTLETGLKYIVRHNNSNSEESYTYYNTAFPYPFMPYLNNDTSIVFKNQQDILGAYMTYTTNINQWRFKAGIRYEYTWLDAIFNEPGQNFSAEYGAFVPSVSITYRMTDMQNLGLGYNKRILRPGIGFLNPYVDQRNPNSISYGNPGLDPENNHNLAMSFSSFGSTYNLSAELSHSFVNNAIEQFSFVQSGSHVQETTFGNIGNNSTTGLNLFGNYRGIKWLMLYMNSSVNYVKMQSEALQISNQGFTGQLFVGGTFMLPKDVRISTGAGGNLPQLTLQGSRTGFMFSYAAISKDFLKKRLNASLSGVVLPKPELVATTTGTHRNTGQLTFEHRTEVKLVRLTELRLNLSYRIGDINAEVKKTRKTISNDDLKIRENNNPGESPL
jgi:outer membrane cobalamin receptor